ncbi:hypothetical protein [Bacterioplanoides sp.]|uniref:hypothetical protein n=1 Tax=Bacterioplanoides sp. TaxID=2066072 RepID=UPI003AFF9482
MRSIYAVFFKMISSLIGILLIWVVAQFLEEKEAGIVIYFYTVVMIVVQLSRSGTEHAILKKLPESTALSQSFILMASLLIVLFVSLISSSLYYGFAFVQGLVYDYSTYSLLFLLMFSAVFFALNQVIATVFQARLKVFWQYFYINSGVVAITLGFWVLIRELYACYGVIGFALSFLLSNVFLFSAGFIWLVRSECLSIDVPLSKKEFYGEVIYIWPFATTAALTIAIQWGGLLLAGFWLDESELGALSIVLRISTFSIFGFLAINSYISPMISRCSENEDFNIVKLTASYSLVSLLFSFAFLGVFFLFGREMLNIIGEAYVFAYPYVVAVVVFWCFRVALGPVDVVLLMTGNVHVNKRNLTISGVLSLVSAVSLIPVFGFWGAVFSLIFSRLLLSILNAIKVYQLFGVLYLSPRAVASGVDGIKAIFFNKRVA